MNNATIDTNGFFFDIGLSRNSTGRINDLKQTSSPLLEFALYDVASAEVTNSGFLGIRSHDFSYLNLTHSAINSVQVQRHANVDIANSELWLLYAAGNSNVDVQNSEITHELQVYSTTEQTLISNLKPATVAHWNYLDNCSVIVGGTGFAPNVTLNNVMVGNWSFSFMDAQHTIMYNSELYGLTLYRSSTVLVYCTFFDAVELFGSSRFNGTDSASYIARLHGNSVVWSLNSTASIGQITDQAMIYDNWYLDVYVEDPSDKTCPTQMLPLCVLMEQSPPMDKQTCMDGCGSLCFPS